MDLLTFFNNQHEKLHIFNITLCVISSYLIVLIELAFVFQLYLLCNMQGDRWYCRNGLLTDGDHGKLCLVPSELEDKRLVQLPMHFLHFLLFRLSYQHRQSICSGERLDSGS